MRTALVTGASSGIGTELARAFARRDHDLILSARSEERLETLAAELRDAHGREVTVLPADLAHPNGPAALLERLRTGGHEVDVLVNNAGVGRHGRFDRIPADEDLDQLRLNALATTTLAKALLPGMVARGRGGVLNVASTAAFQPGPGMAVYYASKAYLLHLSEALSEELRGTGVTVTALCPGPTETAFQERAGMEGARLERQRSIHMDAATAAEAGVRAFQRGQRAYVPGTLNRLGTVIGRLSPHPWTSRAIAWLHAREDESVRG